MASRRAFLAGCAAATLSGRARAETASPADRRFLFVYTLGGWDVTRVFAPLFGEEGVSMEEDADAGTAGGIPFVDHPDRPAVREFFEAWHGRVAVVNGIHLSSIAHASATRLITTGTPDASVADWPTRLAAARAASHLVPNFIVAGPGFAGPYGVHVGRAGIASQLQDLCSGDIFDHEDLGIAPNPDGDAVGRWLAEASARTAARTTGTRSRALTADHAVALEKATRLREIVSTVDLDPGTTFADQVALATRVLSQGISRCAVVAHPLAESTVEWDSHASNDGIQSAMFQDLFTELDLLMELLGATPGASAPTLADETVVVVLSEMGRTPYVNGTGGKDHWPYTSALVWGPGVRGDQVLGAYDAGQYGTEVEGVDVIPNVLGATLLTLGDVDPLAEGIADPALDGLLA